MAPYIKSLLAGGLAAVIALGTLTAPVSANQISLHFSPANTQQQRALQTGLGIYALVKDIESGAITQRGSNNSAGLSQGGRGNLGIVHQEGNGHNGTLEQRNGGNSYGLFQFGNGTNAHVTQRGGQNGLGFVFGW